MSENSCHEQNDVLILDVPGAKDWFVFDREVLIVRRASA